MSIVTSDTELTVLREEMDERSAAFESAPAGLIVAWAVERFGGKLAMASSFQEAVLIDMLMRLDPTARVFTIDKERLRVRSEDKDTIAAFHWRGAPDEAAAALFQVVHEAQASFVPVGHRHGGGAIQFHHWRGLHAQQHIVERDNLRPVRLRCIGRMGMHRGDRGLYRVRAGCPPQGRRSKRRTLGDLSLVPSLPVLVFQQNQIAIAARARFAP